MATIFLILGAIVVANMVGYVPTDLTEHADTNATIWAMIADLLEAFSMSSLAVMAMVIALVIGAFYYIKSRGG